MTWIEKKEGWIGRKEGGNGKKPAPPQKSYSVTEVASLLGISRQTVFKWLSLDEPETAIIPAQAWYRLPSGHIRIREWIVIKLQQT